MNQFAKMDGLNRILGRLTAEVHLSGNASGQSLCRMRLCHTNGLFDIMSLSAARAVHGLATTGWELES